MKEEKKKIKSPQGVKKQKTTGVPDNETIKLIFDLQEECTLVMNGERGRQVYGRYFTEEAGGKIRSSEGKTDDYSKKELKAVQKSAVDKYLQLLKRDGKKEPTIEEKNRVEELAKKNITVSAYRTLEDYDDYKKGTIHKLDDYVRIMLSSYKKKENENNKDYQIRVAKEREEQLEKAGIQMEYRFSEDIVNVSLAMKMSIDAMKAMKSNNVKVTGTLPIQAKIMKMLNIERTRSSRQEVKDKLPDMYKIIENLKAKNSKIKEKDTKKDEKKHKKEDKGKEVMSKIVDTKKENQEEAAKKKITGRVGNFYSKMRKKAIDQKQRFTAYFSESAKRERNRQRKNARWEKEKERKKRYKKEKKNRKDAQTLKNREARKKEKEKEEKRVAKEEERIEKRKERIKNVKLGVLGALGGAAISSGIIAGMTAISYHVTNDGTETISREAYKRPKAIPISSNDNNMEKSKSASENKFATFRENVKATANNRNELELYSMTKEKDMLSIEKQKGYIVNPSKETSGIGINSVFSNQLGTYYETSDEVRETEHLKSPESDSQNKFAAFRESVKAATKNRNELESYNKTEEKVDTVSIENQEAQSSINKSKENNSIGINSVFSIQSGTYYEASDGTGKTGHFENHEGNQIMNRMVAYDENGNRIPDKEIAGMDILQIKEKYPFATISCHFVDEKGGDLGWNNNLANILQSFIEQEEVER